MTSYAYTILYVEDVEKALSFYITVFGFTKKLLTPEGDYAEINSGGTIIAFASTELADNNLPEGYTLSNLNEKPFGIELAFATDIPSSLIEKALENGATLVSPLSRKPWGQQVAYVRDLNGFLLEICTPITTE